jgi:DNA replication protein DnaC
MRKQTVTCECGREFETFICTRDGRELDYVRHCAECTAREAEMENEAELQKKLQTIRENQRAVWAEKCGLERRWFGVSFQSFERERQSKAFDAVSGMKWRESAGAPLRSLVLLSPGAYGVGKTHLASALVNHILRMEEPAAIRDTPYARQVVARYTLPARMYRENELLRRIRSTFSPNAVETEDKVYGELQSPDLLVIDDVGKVRPRDLSFLQGVWFSVIDARYAEQTPVLLTTNLSLAELEEHTGGACADRLREMCGRSGFIMMQGESYRKTEGGKLRSETAAPGDRQTQGV